MAMYQETARKLQKELTVRYQQLYDLLSGKEMSPEERSRYHQKGNIVLVKHDAMAIRLAINDFKGILAEIGKVK